MPKVAIRTKIIRSNMTVSHVVRIVMLERLTPGTSPRTLKIGPEGVV